VAARGAGTYRNSVRVRCEPGPGHAASLRGAVLTRFLPPELNARVEARSARFAAVLPGVRCAGVEYPSIVEGDQHFALFWRTLPWDHVPGALLLQEAGGRAARTDGTEFRADRRGTGLLAASSAAAWDEVRRELLGD
jgi:fructose-1,6-bisphosphatase/inositol monophosphatase family enzyme